MNPEAPDRDLQIELVYQRIKEPARGLLRALIPGDRVLSHQANDGGEGQQLFQKVASLSPGGGEPYRSILAIAAGAKNSTQVDNAYGALAIIEQRATTFPDRPAHYAKRLEISRNYFLEKLAQNPIVLASDEARAMQAQMIGIWQQYKAEPKNVLNNIVSGFRIGNPFSDPQPKVAPYWAEAYLLTILDPTTPLELRKLLLNNSCRFHARSSPGPSEAFGNDVSFVKHVDASWVFPDIFGQSGQQDARDWEIAGLRRKVTDLQTQIQVRPNIPPAERQQMMAAMQQLAEIVKKSEEKLAVYRNIGQHPLDALHIGYGFWRLATPEDRQKMVKEAYRKLAKKYHYQVPHNDPRYDPLLEELANQEFTRLTKAQEYLNGHLSEAEF